MGQDTGRDRFLVNMAVVKVNWAEGSKDILDNYMPLLGYALKSCEHDVVALEDVEVKLRDIVDFNIPRGAIVHLLKRATKPRYGYVRKEQHSYVRVPKKLENLDYERVRDEQARCFRSLKATFRSFCLDRYDVKVSEEEADEYFFEILYEMAPLICRKLKRAGEDESGQARHRVTRRYLVGRFVQHVVNNDPAAFSALEAFVRGAMLTETFYYSSPEDIPRRFRKTTVYFDTTFLLRLLGYCSEAFSKPCQELHEMLSGMSVKMRCFRKTFDEIHRVLFSAEKRLQSERIVKPSHPGDVLDYFTQKGFHAADVTLLIAKLEQNLNKLNIHIEEHPPHAETLTVDETKLYEHICAFIEKQSDRARYHDIDCLTSVFRLREGRPQRYLESCRAIFITTNAALARAATTFFNTQLRASDAPVCMADQVFTTLVWLKAVNKIPDLPKEQLVANCYAALNPTHELWEKYLNEVDELLRKHDIDKDDYAILIHDIEARRYLMDSTLGDEDVSLEGTVPEVLERVKRRYAIEAKKRLDATQHRLTEFESVTQRFVAAVSHAVYYSLYCGLLLVWVSLLAVGLVVSSPGDLLGLVHGDHVALRNVLLSSLFLFLLTISILNLVFGVKLASIAKRLSKRASESVAERVRTKYFSVSPVEPEFPAEEKVKAE